MIVDARGLRCPWPVVRLARALRAHNEVTIVADDPIAPEEIDAFVRETGRVALPVETVLGPGIRVGDA